MKAAAATEPREESWEDVYTSLADPLCRLGSKRYGIRLEDCEDALQKTAQDILLTAGVGIRNRRGYFTTVFLRHCFKFAKATKGRAEVELEDCPEDEDPVVRLEALIRFRSALAHLPKHCQDVIHVWALEGHTQRESAQQLGWSPATVYRRSARCWKRFINVL